MPETTPPAPPVCPPTLRQQSKPQSKPQSEQQSRQQSWLRSGRLPRWIVGLLLVGGGIAALTDHLILGAVALLAAPLLRLPHRQGERADLARPVVWLSWGVVGTTVALLVAGVLDTTTRTGRPSGDAPSVWMRLAELHADLVMVAFGLALAMVFVLAAVGAPRRARRLALELVAAFLAQGALGYAAYFVAAPRPLQVAHLVGAAVLWTGVLRLNRACS